MFYHLFRRTEVQVAGGYMKLHAALFIRAVPAHYAVPIFCIVRKVFIRFPVA